MPWCGEPIEIRMDAHIQVKTHDISDKRLASNILDAIFAVIGEFALLSLGMFNKKFRISLKPIFY